MNFFPDPHTLSVSSVEIHTKYLNKWLSIYPDHKYSLLALLYSPKDSIQFLKSALTPDKATPTILHHYISAVVALFKHSPSIINELPAKDILKKIWEDFQKSNQNPIDARRDSNLPTELQMKKDGYKLNLKQVESIRDSLPSGSIERLLLSIYTYIPPARADYFATEIIKSHESPSSSNYIILKEDNAELVINDFKTKKLYDPIHLDIPTLLYNQIIHSLSINPRKYLFVNSEGAMFSRATFSNWASTILTKILGVKFTLTFFRHIYSSSTDFNDSVENIKKISDAMGHSLAMHKLYQWKISDDSSESSDRKCKRWTDDEKNYLIELVNIDIYNIDWESIAHDLERTEISVRSMYNKLVSPSDHIMKCVSSYTPDTIINILKEIVHTCFRCKKSSYDYTITWKDNEYCSECYSIIATSENTANWELFIKTIKDRGVNACTFCSKPYEFIPFTNRFHFDHIDMFDKTESIYTMLKRGDSIEKVLEEFDKCQLVCSSCHTAITEIERKFGFMRVKRAHSLSEVSYKEAFQPVYKILKGLLSSTK